jgi:SAM-dependent methyltransferase
VVNQWKHFHMRSYYSLVIYQHPLAYLLGLEGIALLHAFAGEYDRDFTEARLAETQDLLDSLRQLGDGATANAITTMDGYRSWAEFYDQPGNQLIDLEQPIVQEILDGLAPGLALDAACGTGRHTEYLASLGNSVIGVDSSPDMLAKARAKVPDGEFHCGDLHLLPVPDAQVDVLVCALALMHVPDLDAPFAEFVRVLKPGGHLIISDWRGLIGNIALPVVKAGPDGRPGFIPSCARLASEYLSAALPLGLQVRRCAEPRRPFPLVDPQGTPPGDPSPVTARPRRPARHLVPAPLVPRGHQCRLPRHPFSHHLALPTRQLLNPCRQAHVWQ